MSTICVSLGIEMSEGKANSAVLENEDLPALLWDKMPDDPSSHPDFMAIQSLTYDESTPLEQMENFKARLNNKKAHFTNWISRIKETND